MDKHSWVKCINIWVCLYLTQNWVKTTQHFLECRYLKYQMQNIINSYILFMS